MQQSRGSPGLSAERFNSWSIRDCSPTPTDAGTFSHTATSDTPCDGPNSTESLPHASRDNAAQTSLSTRPASRRSTPGRSLPTSCHTSCRGEGRRPRLLVFDGVEKIEIALRTQIGHTVGRAGPFAHQVTSTFVSAFAEPHTNATTGMTSPSRLDGWLTRVQELRGGVRGAFPSEVRRSDADLGTGPTTVIERAAGFAAAELRADDYLRGMDRATSIDRLAHHYDQFNTGVSALSK